MTCIKNFALVILLWLSAIGLVYADPTIRTVDTGSFQKSCGSPVDIETTEGRYLFPYHQISVIKVSKSALTGTVHLTIRVGDGITTLLAVPDATNISKLVDKFC